MLSENEFNAIRDGGKTEVLEIDGVNYVTKPVFDPRQPDPVSTPLVVAGLSGLVEYLAAHKDDPGMPRPIAHVVGFDRVDLIGLPVDRFRLRHTYATAKAAWPEGLKFGQYLDLETMNVQLQALFAGTTDREKVLAVVGKVEDVNTAEVADDGVTQSITVKAGISRLGREQAPNPVFLAPFRTFRELDQPLSQFILRLRAGTPPTAALHEADGGAWKLEAVKRIKVWLAENLPAETPIVG